MKMNERPELNLTKLKDKALRLLARRDHSEYELKQKLRTRGKFDDSTFSALIDYLKNLGYLADQNELSRRWIRQFRSEGRGRHWITGKLRTKGLPALDLRDDEEEFASARLFVAKKLRGKNPKALKLNEKAKLSRSLVSRGFSSSVVATVMNEEQVDENESI